MTNQHLPVRSQRLMPTGQTPWGTILAVVLDLTVLLVLVGLVGGVGF